MARRRRWLVERIELKLSASRICWDRINSEGSHALHEVVQRAGCRGIRRLHCSRVHGHRRHGGLVSCEGFIAVHLCLEGA